MTELISDYHQKVDKRLITRQRIFFVVIVILGIIGVVNVASHKISITTALIAFATSTLVGLAFSRMFKIFWHQEKEKVMSQLDTTGIIFLVLYIGIEVGKSWIFGHWFSGPTLTALGLIIVTGLILGRFLGTLFKINKVLSEN